MAIKHAINNADKVFNEELFDYFCSKDDVSFWRAWHKRYCSSSVKSVNTINGKHGDHEICGEFTEQLQSVFRPNTVNSDAKYELELQDLWRWTANYEDAFPKIDIDLCQRSPKENEVE